MDSAHDFEVHENTLNRNFGSDCVNEKWVNDITYIPSEQCWTYLTAILDRADRMVVAWSMSDDMTARNTSIEAFKIALKKRKVNQKLLFDSDRGIQYCGKEFRQTIKQTKLVEQCMSRKMVQSPSKTQYIAVYVTETNEPNCLLALGVRFGE
jgi:transposase InsO family protein